MYGKPILMHKAIALYSGGLDSLLSTIIVKAQKIDVIAVKFLTGFVSSLKEKDYEYAKQFGFPLKEKDISEKFLSILKNLEHGYGKNLNPCIDCKVLMLKEVKELMSEYGASFVVTGEVLFQRPMSQKRDTLLHIEKKAFLNGLILRPLSAKLLPPTKPEIEGIINRTLLYELWGRGRKSQISLAKQLGIEEFPQPAGGCLLTDPLFCKKVQDLINHNQLTISNTELLKIGRHFRLSERCKVIVGRNEKENEILMKKEGEI
jgi:tRNA U34 2-thiouridine synthase MnmA/TrmU